MPEELLYEGKAKKVFATDEDGVLVHRYKDDATAFNAQKRGSWKDKGRTNATMSAAIFAYLEAHGLAFIISILFWRAAPLRCWHLTGRMFTRCWARPI